MARTPVPGRKHAILDAALFLFAKKGYSASTMADIAKQAKVATGTLYLYYDNKEKVLKECAERFHQLHKSEVAEIMASPSSADEKLQHYLLTRFRRWKSETKGARAGSDLAVAMIKISPRITKQEDLLWKKTLRGILQQGVSERSFKFTSLNMELRIFYINLTAYFPLPGAPTLVTAKEEEFIEMIQWFCQKWSAR